MSPGRDGTGLRALQAHHTVRLEGGFVCAIDGRPATGCATNPSSGTAYWSYWHAAPGGSWEYSQVGAGGFRLSAPCSIEGWVWSSSPATATPPRVSPGSLDCDPPRPAAPAPTSPAPAAPTGGGGSAGAGVAGTVPAGGTGANGAPAPDGAAPPSDAPRSGGGAVAAADDAASDGGAAAVPGAGDREEADDAGRDAGDDADRVRSGTDEPGDSARAGNGAEPAGDELAAATSGSEPGGAPWGVLIGTALVLAVGAAAVLRARRRAAPPG